MSMMETVRRFRNEQIFDGKRSLGLHYLWLDALGNLFVYCLVCRKWVSAQETCLHLREGHKSWHMFPEGALAQVRPLKGRTR